MKKAYLFVLAVVFLITGCNVQPTATPVVTRSQPETRVEHSPTAKPVAEATVPQPHPPVVLEFSPAQSEEVAPESEIVVVFDQPMDAGTVALSLRPGAAGQMIWQDDATLRFMPDEPLARDTRYTVEVGPAATSQTGLSVGSPVWWTFRTVGDLAVVNAFPAPGSQDVTTEVPVVRLVFNRPVAPLGESGDVTPALDIEPGLAGQGEWTSTSVWTWTPDMPLRAGTVYTMTLDGALTSLDGAAMADDYVWSFTTSRPRVEHIEPAADERYAPRDTAIEVVFSQAMDRRSAESAISVLDVAGNVVLGQFLWDGNTLRFAPSKPLIAGADYVAVVSEKALAAGGEVALARPTRWTFRVAPVPALSRITPVDGAENVKQSADIKLYFTSPISRATLLEGVTITPTFHTYAYWTDQDTVVDLGGWMRPSTQYTVTVGEGILGSEGTPVDGGVEFSFTTGPAEPMLSLDVPGRTGTYNANVAPEMALRARNVDQVELSLFEISQGDLLGLEGQDGWRRWEAFRPSPEHLVRQWSLTTTGEPDEVVRLTTELAPRGALAPGYYMISADAREIKEPRRHVLIVSPINLTLKAGESEALIWATDLETGQPVADLPLTLYDAAGRAQSLLVTDHEGIATAPMPDQERWDPLTVLTPDDAPVAAVGRTWSDGIDPYAFGFSVSYGSDENLGYLYSDRAIYRPGHVVHLKGIVRRNLDARYALLSPGSKVAVEVRDPEDRVVLRQELSLSAMGTFNVDVTLDDAAKLGRYWVRAELAGVDQDYPFHYDFRVAEYRKPVFQLDVLPYETEVMDGDTLQVQANAAYYSGGSVGEADVSWRVYSQPWVFDRYDGTGYWSWTDWDMDDMPRMWRSGQNQIAEGSGRTDSEGRFILELPADLQDKSQSQRWTVEVSVADKTFQQVSARASVIVHRSEVYVGVSAQEIVGQSGQRQGVHLLALDSTGQADPGRELTVVFHKHEWYSAKQEADDGEFYWTNAVRDTPLVTRTVTTDADGYAESWFVPEEGGTYKVVVVAHDDQGREARAALYLWVSGAGYINWGQANDDRIDLVADKSAYAPGDVAKVLVPSPFDEPVLALLTLERGDVLEHKLITLSSNSEILELPMTAEYAPNVFVSLVMIKGMGRSPVDLSGSAVQKLPALKLGYVVLPVSIQEQIIDIKIESDRKSYAPGETAQYRVTTRDHTGQGVPAEVSLQLVDLAVEALTGAQAPRIIEHFYHERGLGVLTAATLAISVDRRTLEYPEEGKGGGGGPDEAGEGVRSAFADTAYWAPAVMTDETGSAEVEVRLPDNLTTWRMTAQGVTANTLVGAEQYDVVSSLPLQVRPIAPRFLLAGDRPVLGALVQNNTEQPQQVGVELTAEGIDVSGGAQDVTVPAGDSVRVTWLAEAAQEAGLGRLRYEATAGRFADAVEITLPIHAPSYPDVVGTSGQVSDQVTEVVMLPEGASREQGGLSVSIETSLTSAMAPGLEYLRTYPYLCVEQTVSRFMPNLAYVYALDEGGVDATTDREALSQQVAMGIQRLTAIQNLDGGWGWWSGRASREDLTAYVLLGLAQARQAGYAVDHRTFDGAVAYLYRWLDNEPGTTQRDRDLRATVLYSLAAADDGDLGRSVVLADDDGAMSLYAKALLAMTLQRLDPESPERPERLANQLLDKVVLSASGAHWEEDLPGGWAMNTDTRTTALVLRALVTVSPDNPLLPQAVRWLMTARSVGRWQTTQENAWAIMALTDYAVATGDLHADYVWDVALNGRELARGRAEPGAVGMMALEVPMAELESDQANLLRIARDDATAGRLYYSAFLSVYHPADEVEPLDRGLMLRREYTVLGADGQQKEEVSVGDTISCKLTLIAPHDTFYLVLEDPLPAGCEALDTSLDISSMDVAAPMLERAPLGKEAELSEAQRLYWEWHYRWPSHTELRDDRVALFTEELPRGTYEYTYQMRCTTPGEFQVLPAMAYGMYAPDVFGRSGGESLYIAGAR